MEALLWAAIIVGAIGFLLALTDSGIAKFIGVILTLFGWFLFWGYGQSYGQVGVSSAIKDSATYVLMGTPIDSLAEPGSKIITVHSAAGGDLSFAVAAFPPAGFKVTKTDDGKTLLVPDENKGEGQKEFVPPKK